MRIPPPNPLSIATIYIAAIIMAVDQGFKPGSAISQAHPALTMGPVWNYVPLGFLTIGTAIWLIAPMLQSAGLLSPKIEKPDPLWKEKLKVVTGRDFRNCDILLDGTRYVSCKFNGVTFIYNGEPFALENNDIGAHIIKSTNPKIARAMTLLVTLGHTKSGLYEDRGPITLAELDARHGNRRS